MQEPENCSRTIRCALTGMRFHWKVLTMVMLWAICVCLHYLPISPETVEEYYSKGYYRIIVSSVTAITGAVSFSVILMLLYIMPFVFFFACTGVWIYRRRKLKQSHWRGALWGGQVLLFVLPIFWLWFLVFWGMGYQRLPIGERLCLDDSTVTEEEVRRIENRMLEIIQRDQPRQQSDRNVSLAIQSVSAAMQEVISEWDGVPIQIPERVKSTPPGLFLMNGTSGMCVPLTLEPHIDGGLPDTAFVSVAAHELAHIAGLCDEGETNLLGYAAGLRADNPYARYAVALSVYRSLFGRNREEQAAALQRLPAQAQEDLKRASAASQRYRINWLQKWSWRAYNQYLKSQGVQDGLKSYGRGTELLVYAWRAGYIALPDVSAAPEID